MPGTDALAELRRPETMADPSAILRRLREQEPVHFTSAGYYLLSRHADALWMQQRTGSVFLSPDRQGSGASIPAPGPHRALDLFAFTLPALNGPAHDRLRRLVGREFSAARIEVLRGRTAAACDRLLNEVAGPLHEGEIVDLHSTVSRPLTMHVLAELLGVPETDRSSIAGLILDISNGVRAGTGDLLALADDQAAQLELYFLDLIGRPRRSAPQDLISALTCARRASPDRISQIELVAQLWMVWLGGFETTAAGIDHSVLALAAEPGLRRHLAGGYGAALAFADEVLRHSAIVLYPPISRIAAERVRFPGVTLEPGSAVRPLLAAANRDPAVFPDPDRFDPARENSAAIPFGHGAHYCVGSGLARMEMAVALARIRDRFPTLAVVGEPAWSDADGRRVPSTLRVALEGRRSSRP